MLAELLGRIRGQLELKQFPSISEAIEWANLLHNTFKVMDISNRYKNELIQTINIIAKNDYDLNKIRILLNNIL